MAFNPNEHMMSLKGKDYLQVAWRLVWFREDHPDWSLDTNILEMDENHAIFKAVISNENGEPKSVGHGSESMRDFGDFLEKAETKAVGRALAMLGYGTQFAADELDEGERIVDSPIQRGSVEAAKAVGEKKLEDIKAKMAAAPKPATTKQMATDEQKQMLRSMVNVEQMASCVKSYGPNWERMTYKAAEQLIAKIRGETA